MLVIMGFYHRKQGLTWEQFSDHWKNVHGPLLRDSPQTAKYIRRYVQHHIRPNTAFPGVKTVGLRWYFGSLVRFDRSAPGDDARPVLDRCDGPR